MPGVGKGIKIHTHLDNIRELTFNMKRYGQNAPWDVSGASQILLEAERNSTGTHLTPIVADSGAPGADWANGIVKITIDSTNVTGAVDTYTFGVTVFIGGQEVTTDEGTIEVAARPGYPPP